MGNSKPGGNSKTWKPTTAHFPLMKLHRTMPIPPPSFSMREQVARFRRLSP